MTTNFTGTLYLPGQPPRQLSRTEIAGLDLLIRPSRDGNTITARAREVSKILGVRDNDPLYACATAAVWGAQQRRRLRRCGRKSPGR